MRQYFIHDGQAKKGPFTFDELKEYHLKKDTLVWHDGLKDWAKAGDLEDFSDHFNQKIIPPPLPKTFVMNTASRDKILNSFEDAAESYRDKPKTKAMRWFIIITIIIILGIIATIFFYH